MKSLLLAATATVLLATTPLVSRAMLQTVEKRIDQKLESLFDEPFLLLGLTRGVYLEKYGAVFSAELQLVVTPGVGTFGFTTPSKELIASTRAKKLERLPQLKQAMRGQLVSAATLLERMPPGENVVLAVSLFRRNWEDADGLPSQVVMRAQRKSLLAARTSAAIEAAIRLEEF
ncbi:MAG: hypothetical protein NW208_10390 [Bryobacter sp.]|nr:hypothetical protein [Bryobacter sp.]